MISLSHRFLFIHVPKTAGNSLTEKLKIYCEDKVVCDRPNWDGEEDFGLINRYGLKKHASVTQWREALGAETFRAYFKFTVIRNPWERMLSHFLHQQRKTGRDNRGFNPGRFERWVRNGWAFDKTCALELPAHRPWRKPETVYPFDFYLRFDHLEEDWEHLCRILDIPPQPLEHRNKGDVTDYRALYTPDTYRMIARRCAREINYFHHRF